MHFKKSTKNTPNFQIHSKNLYEFDRIFNKNKKKAKKADYNLTFKILLHKIVAGGNNEQN